jgi:predicted MFS family arabinose efflux permease
MGTSMASAGVAGRTARPGRLFFQTASRRYPKSTAQKQQTGPSSWLERKWLGLGIILIGPFLGTIDFFIANIGVPTIRSALGASFSQIELVIAGYGLTYAVCLISGGRLGDIYGRKRMFLAGMAGFTVTSAL